MSLASLNNDRKERELMFIEPVISARRNTHLQVEEFMCRRCGVQATNEPDAVCQLCKAIGKSAEPLAGMGIWSDIRFGGTCVRRFVFGLDA